MNELFIDIMESIDFLREKRMKKIWKTNRQLKELIEQEHNAEQKYKELELDENAYDVIDRLLSCINERDDFQQQLSYIQGLKDGWNISSFKDSAKED